MFKCKDCGCEEIEQVEIVDCAYTKVFLEPLEYGEVQLGSGYIEKYQCWECGKEIGKNLKNIKQLKEYLNGNM